MLIYQSHYCLVLIETSQTHWVRPKDENSWTRFIFVEVKWNNGSLCMYSIISLKTLLKKFLNMAFCWPLLTRVSSLRKITWFQWHLFILRSCSLCSDGNRCFFPLWVCQLRCVAVFHHELVTFSLVLCSLLSLFFPFLHNFSVYAGYGWLCCLFKQMTGPKPGDKGKNIKAG